MGQMNRAIAREEDDRRKQDRLASTLVIAASIIAAVRLAREDIGRPSPRLASVIVDSIGLARTTVAHHQLGTLKTSLPRPVLVAICHSYDLEISCRRS